MTKDFWVKKFTSRKFWATIASFITSIFIFFTEDENVGVQISTLVLGLGSIIAYVFGESWVDSALNNKTKEQEKEVENEWL